MTAHLASATALPPHAPSRRLYFLTEALPEAARNLHRVYPPVRKHGVILDGSDPSASAAVFCGTVIGLDDGRYRLYYTSRRNGAMRIAIAESDDGLRWERLSLAQERRPGFDENVIVIEGAPSQPLEDAGSGDGTLAADGRVIEGVAGRNRQDQTGQPQVLRLSDGRWRMYYWHHQHGWGRVPYLYTVAESDDGLRWRVPDYGRPALNSHWLGDQSALSEEQRLAEKSRRTNDANFVYYNPRIGCFEQFSQWFLDAHPDRRVPEDNCPDFNRMIQRRTSADGLTWSAPELVIQADPRDPWDLQFYHLAVQYHEDWYIGSLGHYRVENEQQTMDLELVFSRDGREWERPMRAGLIAREPGGRDAEGIYPPNAWIDRGDEWLCLYTATARKHNRHADPSLPSTCVMGASWAKHRFVGLAAGATPGGFLTPVFYPQGEEIRVDADVRGVLRAELCDAWGRRIEGYRLSQSVPVTGDDGGHVLRWHGVDTTPFRHDPVRLRFEYADAAVYGVAF